MVVSAAINNWQNWLPLVFSLISVVVALLSVWVTIQGYLRGKPKLKVEQPNDANGAVLIEPEWIQKTNGFGQISKNEVESPDTYGDRRYRVIMEVTIKNQSSNPISIGSFELNHYFRFAPYSQPADEYEVVIRAGKVALPKGGTAYGPSKKITHPIYDGWLTPVIRINPFGVTSGYLFFSVYEDELTHLKIGSENTLTLETTFKNYDYSVHLNRTEVRDKRLPPIAEWNFSYPFNV